MLSYFSIYVIYLLNISYFGSETKPPCEENTRWFIFAK